MMNPHSLWGLRLGCGGKRLIHIVVDSRLRGKDGWFMPFSGVSNGYPEYGPVIHADQ